jgi:hypothetical protein
MEEFFRVKVFSLSDRGVLVITKGVEESSFGLKQGFHEFLEP